MVGGFGLTLLLIQGIDLSGIFHRKNFRPIFFNFPVKNFGGFPGVLAGRAFTLVLGWTFSTLFFPPGFLCWENSFRGVNPLLRGVHALFGPIGATGGLTHYTGGGQLGGEKIKRVCPGTREENSSRRVSLHTRGVFGGGYTHHCARRMSLGK